MSTRTKIIAGAAVVLIVGVVFAAVWTSNEASTKVIAVIGCAIAIAKWVYDIVEKEMDQRKKADDRRERVKFTVKFDNFTCSEPELGVVVYNDGDATVNVESVFLQMSEGVWTNRYQMLDADAQPTALVQPKNTAEFVISAIGSFDVNQLTRIPADRLRIMVRSHAGGEWTIPGQDIAKAIQWPGTAA